MTTAATGPKVFLDYDQDALDAAYDQNVYAPNREQIAERNNANSAAVRARIGEPERIAYGTRPEEHLDLFRTKAPNAPIFVFVRGGAWRATGIERYAFVAELFVRAGAHCVIPQYAGVENVDGKLLTLAGQVRSAVAWVYKNAARIGGDPAKLYVGGHSSGAHMAGVVAITEWERFGVPPDAVKGVLCSSGMYELHPVSLSNAARTSRSTNRRSMRSRPSAISSASACRSSYRMVRTRRRSSNARTGSSRRRCKRLENR